MKIDEEKSYNEMANDIKQSCNEMHEQKLCSHKTTICAFCAVGNLIEQGWRKEKDTAKQIFSEIRQAAKESINYSDLRRWVHVWSKIEELEKRFGVEVEE